MVKKKETTTDKKPITILSTDWHLKESNIEQIKGLITQKCELAKSLDIDTVFCLGDIFDSRAGQKVSILVAFSEILEIFSNYQIKLWAIPGNHDKQGYLGFESFVDPFKYHPNFKYINRAGGVPIGNIMFQLLPYFKETMWLERFRELEEYVGEFGTDDFPGKKHVLLSHIALNGSTNNDGTKVNCNISVSDFKNWDLVLLGHYHDQQQVGVNVFHIPSIQQNNFGENDQKGFTVVYDDCSFELHKSSFKEYKKVVIDFDNTTKKQLETILKDQQCVDKFVRLEFVGSSDRLKALNKEELQSLGFNITVKVKEIEDTIEFAEEEIKEHTKESIVEEFKQFCTEKSKDYEIGIIHLNKKLEK